MRGVTYSQAQALIAHALKLARQMGLPPLSVVVLDNGGHVKASASEDGVGTLRYEIARSKANAALGMGMDSIHFSRLLSQGTLSEAFSNALVGAAGGNFNPNPGGVLIHLGGQVAGAIGISGAAALDDHKVASFSIDKLKEGQAASAEAG